MTHSGWEHFHHVADIGVHGYGTTPDQAFEQAALALTAVVIDPAGILPTREITISCVADDIELLFTDWLNSLIYEMDLRQMLFSRFQVRITLPKLQARAWGETIDLARHAPAVEAKGATFTSLEVRKNTHGLWTAQCIVDV